MLLRNRGVWGLIGLALPAMLVAQTLPTPPDDLPKGEGPSGTSQMVPGQERYDEVGYAGVDLGDGIVVSHASLPTGSFVEITVLDTGKTIAVMVSSQQPPMRTRVIAISTGVGQALGLTSDLAAVRVRRVEPNLPDQTALKAGRVLDRLDTPKVLLSALQKRLPAAPPMIRARPEPQRPVAATRIPGTSYAPPTRVVPAPPRVPTGSGPGYYVQIAALSNAARAEALASSMGGAVVPGGGLYRVRIGPYRDARTAQNARDAAAARGYGDARIVNDR